MGYSVYWYVPERVCVLQVYGDLSLEELKAGSDQAIEFIRSGKAPVHLIADPREVKSIPKNLNQVQKMAQVFREPNIGWVFLLNDDRIVTFFSTVILQLARVNHDSFHSPGPMIQKLRKIDPTLPTLAPYPGDQVNEVARSEYRTNDTEK